MSITSGGMGRSIGRAIREGIGGGAQEASITATRPTRGMLFNQFRQSLLPWDQRAIPRPNPRAAGRIVQPPIAEPPVTDPHMIDRPFQPGGRTAMERYNASHPHFRAAAAAGQRGGGAQELRIANLPRTGMALLTNYQSGQRLTNKQRQLLARMTPSQKRAVGVFHDQKGRMVPAKRVANRAVQNLIAGKGLTRNQNTLLGNALKGMTPNQRRQLAVQLSIAKNGIATTRGRESFGKAIGKAYRVASQVAKNARSSTQIQRIAAARPTKVYKTAAGKTRTVTQVLKTAVQYAKSGKQLRPTHKQALKGLNVNQLKRLGVPKAGKVAKQLRNNARRSGRRR